MPVAPPDRPFFSRQKVKQLILHPINWLTEKLQTQRAKYVEKHFVSDYKIQQHAAATMTKAPLFLQEQMDLNPVSRWHKPALIVETGGFFLPGETVERKICDTDPNDCVRRDMLVLLLRSINERRIEGDLAELGVYRGLTARLFHQYMPDRTLHLFDTFEGFSKEDLAAEQQRKNFTSFTGGQWKTAKDEVDLLGSLFCDTSVEKVLSFIQPRNANIKVNKGKFPSSVKAELQSAKFAFVHLDADIYEPTLAGLEFFYPRLSAGGVIVVHDYNTWPGARKAVQDFFSNKPEIPLPMPDKSGSAVIIKH
jgi:O-methyltransferase